MKNYVPFPAIALVEHNFPPIDFDKNLQMVSFTATERHRMKKLKFHRLQLVKRHPFPVTLLDASLQTG